MKAIHFHISISWHNSDCIDEKPLWGQVMQRNACDASRKVLLCNSLYPVDLEVWSKLVQCARIKRIASKFARNFDCDWQHVSAFSHSITLTRRYTPSTFANYLLLWYKRAGSCFYGMWVCVQVWFMYRSFYFITSRSTECIEVWVK